MQVTSGFSFERLDNRWRKVSVSLNIDDLLRLVEEGFFPGWQVGDPPFVVDAEGKNVSTAELFKALMKTADRYVIVQMAKEGAMTHDEAKKQIAAL